MCFLWCLLCNFLDIMEGDNLFSLEDEDCNDLFITQESKNDSNVIEDGNTDSGNGTMFGV